jgi:hypothetical protein
MCLQGLCTAEPRSVTPEVAGSSPVAPVRSGPQRAAAARNSFHARRTNSLPVTFLLTAFAVRRAPASAGHWAIVRTRPAQQVEVVQARWSGARCRPLASSTPTITGSPPLGRPHCARKRAWLQLVARCLLLVPSGRELGASGDARLSKEQWRRGSLRVSAAAPFRPTRWRAARTARPCDCSLRRGAVVSTCALGRAPSGRPRLGRGRARPPPGGAPRASDVV